MISFLIGAIALATVFLFGCVGEIITEKAGHLNLGIPGIMCVGTAGGCWAVSLYMASLANPKTDASWFLLMLLAILMAFLFAAALGGIYGILTVTLRCNQNITGLAVTIFGNGFAQFFMDTCVLRSDADRANFEIAGKLISRGFSFADDLGWFGRIFLSHGLLVYLAIAVALLAAWFLKRTRAGLHLRAVGESPATADAAGINVTAYKYGAILTGSGIAGLGGFFYIMDLLKGSWENAATIEAQIFIKNGASPIERILPTIFQSKWNASRLNRKNDFFEQKCDNAIEKATNCEITVAAAEPRMPHPNLKIKSGLSTRLTATEVSIIAIDLRGFPDARIISFIPR